MEVIVEKSISSVARRAAGIVEEYLGAIRRPVLGLATGASVQPLYRELIQRFNQGTISFVSSPSCWMSTSGLGGNTRSDTAVSSTPSLQGMWTLTPTTCTHRTATLPIWIWNAPGTTDW